MTYNHDNVDLEIKRIKGSIFNFAKDQDIIRHEWGDDEDDRRSTYRAKVTVDKEITVLGWKLIRLAILGRSWRYMARHTGIRKDTIAHLFQNNPIIRAAVVELEHEIVEESKGLLVRSIRSATKNLIKLATGKTNITADKMKAQLEAIRELYNRAGFAIPGKGGGGSGNFVITLQSGEAHDLGLLIQRRVPQLTEGGDTDGRQDEVDEEEAGETEGGSVEDRSVAGGGGSGEVEVVDADFTPRD